jgi:hypothetical protein
MHFMKSGPAKTKGCRLAFRKIAVAQGLVSRPNSAEKAIDYALWFSRAQDAVIHVYDSAGNVIVTHEHKGSLRSGSVANRCGFEVGEHRQFLVRLHHEPFSVAAMCVGNPDWLPLGIYG